MEFEIQGELECFNLNFMKMSKVSAEELFHWKYYAYGFYRLFIRSIFCGSKLRIMIFFNADPRFKSVLYKTLFIPFLQIIDFANVYVPIIHNLYLFHTSVKHTT